MAIVKPDLSQQWASDGDKIAPSGAKIQAGWGPEIPPYQWENFIQNRQDEMLAYLNERGIPEWDNRTNYVGGGKSYVQGSDGKVYKSVAASGPASVVSNPTTGASDTYWTVAFADVGAFLTQTQGDARYTQRANNLSDLTNTAAARTNLGAAPLASPTFTGTVTAPNFSGNGSQLTALNASNLSTGTVAVARGGTGATATTGTGDNVLSASPALTGVPTAPTAAVGTNTTQLATTAFVKAAGDTRYTQRSNNLSDLSNIPTARTNLGLNNAFKAGIAGSSSNLKASATGTNATVTVTADSICLKNSNNEQVVVNALALTINSVTVGANGLDTGVLAASTWYAVWVIWDGSTVAGLLSLSATAPTMPAGYTYKARTGWIRTDASANKFPLSFNQKGNRCFYVPATGSNLTGVPKMASGVQGSAYIPVWVAVPVASFVPPTTAMVYALVVSTNQGPAIAAPNNSYGGCQSLINPPPIMTWPAAMNIAINSNADLPIESENIYYAGSDVSSGLFAKGWEDSL